MKISKSVNPILSINVLKRNSRLNINVHYFLGHLSHPYHNAIRLRPLWSYASVYNFFIFYFLKTTTQIAAIILVWLICRIKRNYIMKFTILSPYGLTRDTNMKKGQTFKNPLHYPHTLGKKIHSWVWWRWCHQTSISWSLGGGSGTWVGLI